MKLNLRATLFLAAVISSSLIASEKQQAEETQQGMKRAREVGAEDAKLGKVTRPKDFHRFPELFQELRELIIKEYIYKSLYGCSCYEDYEKLYRSLTTSKDFQKAALLGLGEISRLSEDMVPELCYKYEILKLFAKLDKAHLKTCLHRWFGSDECPDSDPADCKWHPSQNHDPEGWPLVVTVASKILSRSATSTTYGDYILPEGEITYAEGVETLKSYIYADKNFASEEQRFDLFRKAFLFGHFKMLVQLINRCAIYYVDKQDTIDIHAKDKNGTLIKWAYRFGCDKAVDLLLSLPKSIKEDLLVFTCYGAYSEKGRNPEGFRKCVRGLLSLPESDVNQCDGVGVTPLMYASMSGDLELVRILLAIRTIKINERDDYQWTALMRAIQFGHRDVVQALLDLPGIDTDGSVLAATRYGRWDIVRMLHEIPHIDVNFKVQGRTALMEALIDAVDSGNFGGYPDFDFPCDLENLRLLLSFPNIDVNIRADEDDYADDDDADDGLTALTDAIKTGRTELVEEILRKGGEAEINLQHDWRNPALIEAVKRGYVGIVALLLKIPGIDVNIQNAKGLTVLMVAAKKGYINMVKLLLAIPETNIHLKHNDQDAMKIASAHGHQEIHDLLQEHFLNEVLR